MLFEHGYNFLKLGIKLPQSFFGQASQRTVIVTSDGGSASASENDCNLAKMGALNQLSDILD